MMFVSWAAYFEGKTDDDYFRVLLPRVIEDVLCRNGGRLPATIADYPSLRLGEHDRSVQSVAAEICEGMEAFDLLFVHADTGGRALQAGVLDRCLSFATAAKELCGFDEERLIPLCPRHETEAWALADPDAVCMALGFRGSPKDLGVPSGGKQAERLGDPKSVLLSAIRAAGNRRKRIERNRVMPLIAQSQRLDCLREMASYRGFESSLLATLGTVGFLR